MLFETPCCIPSTCSPSQGKPPHHHHPPPTRKICYKKSHNLAMVLRTGWTGEWSSANWRNRSKTTALRLNYDWKWMIPEKNVAIECLWKEVFDNKNDADDGDNSNWWMQGGIQARCHWVSLMLFLMMMMIDYLMNARESVRARCHWVWHRIEKLLRPSAFSEATWRKKHFKLLPIMVHDEYKARPCHEILTHAIA